MKLKSKLEALLYKPMTARLLKQVIPIILASFSNATLEELSAMKTKVPLPIGAFLQYLQLQLPRVYTSKDKQKKLGGGDKSVAWYQVHFPRGKICFTIPIGGRVWHETPGPMYESIQGTTIYLTRWDLNAPDIIIQCYSCNKGILEHTRSQVSTQATPIFNLCGRSSWEFGTSLNVETALDNGKSVFLPDARAAVQLMKENVEHIPVMIEDAYREIRPTGGRSKHNLVRYVAEKGESSLEQFHHLLAHFGNMGTRRTITDSLCLRGTARHNLKMWTKLLSEDEIDHSIPSHFSRHP